MSMLPFINFTCFQKRGDWLAPIVLAQEAIGAKLAATNVIVIRLCWKIETNGSHELVSNHSLQSSRQCSYLHRPHVTWFSFHHFTHFMIQIAYKTEFGKYHIGNEHFRYYHVVGVYRAYTILDANERIGVTLVLMPPWTICKCITVQFQSNTYKNYSFRFRRDVNVRYIA